MSEEPEADGGGGPPALLVAAGFCASALALALAVGALAAGQPFGFDRTLILLLHGTGPGWLRAAMIDITALGGTTVLTLVTVAAMAMLLTGGHRATALLIAAATISGSGAVTLLKGLFGRARPGIVDHLVEASGMSFPSGHAANSALVYLTLAALASQVAEARAARNVMVGGAILLVAMIGATRVYLGVHWPSDVMAGWSFGTLWAIGWWRIARRTRPMIRAEIG